MHQLAKRLGLVKALGHSREAKLILWLIYATLIEPGSRLSAVRLAQRHVVCDILNVESFNEDDLYEAMDWLDERQDSIEKRLFSYRYKEKNPELFLYDVTSSYFEGMCNELADWGFNRDKKNGKKQIVVGLMTDEDGFPISVEVFRGNTRDLTTFVGQTKKASAATIHERYKSLSDVEWAFRTMKTTLLELRAIFVRKAQRTRAHVFIMTMAYMVTYELRHLWSDVEMTVEEGTIELASLYTIQLTINGMSCQTIPQPRPRGKLLLEKASITLPDAIPHRNVRVDTRVKFAKKRRTL